ncbi:MAG TPA: hypothetical protein PJ986_11960 [Gammaproteobacteria bacterium]|nr:hypothetical protein [Gammaproteobacteria bacterium]
MATAKSTRAPARNVSAKSTPRRRRAKALPAAAPTAAALENAGFRDFVAQQGPLIYDYLLERWNGQQEAALAGAGGDDGGNDDDLNMESEMADVRRLSKPFWDRWFAERASEANAATKHDDAASDEAVSDGSADEISLNELAKTLHDWDMKRRHKEYLVKYFCAVLGDSEEELKEALEGWADDPAEATYRAACELEDEYCTRSLRDAMNRTDAALDVLADNWEEIGREHLILLIDALRQRVSRLGQHLDAALAERFCMAYRGERGVDLDEPYIVSKKIQLLGLPEKWSTEDA